MNQARSGTLSRVGQRLVPYEEKGWSTKSGKWVLLSSPSLRGRERAKPYVESPEQPRPLPSEGSTILVKVETSDEREPEEVGNDKSGFGGGQADRDDGKRRNKKKTNLYLKITSRQEAGFPQKSSRDAAKLQSWTGGKTTPAGDQEKDGDEFELFLCTLWQVCAVGRCPRIGPKRSLTLHSGFQALLGKEISGDRLPLITTLRVPGLFPSLPRPRRYLLNSSRIPHYHHHRRVAPGGGGGVVFDARIYYRMDLLSSTSRDYPISAWNL
ncbi:hypothetical protein MGG_15676 [Pyricularia oryzae 70-15]|uniref:Uncharacterized protein n=1 Tax=Pyricularia oryzae (strain 70-15 / ATCC MYA-4617 / FGSC 8958) TaxID=242507 RepID=G4MYP5_PYRO7|nr:uncharacterized protein MGG_15676 [Pyricularia oryzae 70-15]EHA54470.1 hypothetical protein MGG_15676 [Pyricularia oryzae 70-15]